MYPIWLHVMIVKPPADWRPTVYRARSQILWFNLHKTLSRSSPTLQVRDWSSEKVSNLPKVTQLEVKPSWIQSSFHPTACAPGDNRCYPPVSPISTTEEGQQPASVPSTEAHFPRPTFRTYVLMLKMKTETCFHTHHHSSLLICLNPTEQHILVAPLAHQVQLTSTSTDSDRSWCQGHVGQVTGDGGSAGALGLPSQHRPLHRPRCSSEPGVRLSLGSSSISSSQEVMKSPGNRKALLFHTSLTLDVVLQESRNSCLPTTEIQRHQVTCPTSYSLNTTEARLKPRTSDSENRVWPRSLEGPPQCLLLSHTRCQAVISRVKAHPVSVGARRGELGFVVQRHLEMRVEERNRETDRLREQSSFWAEDMVQEV